MKEKVTDVTTKLDMKKILPRKSTRATPRSPIPNEPQKPIEEGDALAKAKAVEKRAKEKSIKKQKVQSKLNPTRLQTQKPMAFLKVQGKKERRK